MRPGIVALWLLIFISPVRELGAAPSLTGPHSVIGQPSWTWLTASSSFRRWRWCGPA
jgi:hypothetical protein